MQKLAAFTCCGFLVFGLVRPAVAAYTLVHIAGGDESGFAGDGGQATAALLNHPEDLAVATDGAVYIADTGNNRIRRVSTVGNISTVAGNGSADSTGDGGLAVDAALSAPRQLAVDHNRNLFVVEGQPPRVRRIDADSGRIETFLGPAVWRYAVENDRMGNVFISLSPSNPYANAFLLTLGVEGESTFAPIARETYRIGASAPDQVVVASGDYDFAVTATSGRVLFEHTLDEYALGTPSDIALADQGTLYFTAGSFYSGPNRYVLTARGPIFQSVAGGGCGGVVDGAQADTAALQPRALAIGRELLYVVHAPSQVFGLRRQPARPGTITGTLTLPGGSNRVASVYAYGDDGSSHYTRPSSSGRFRFRDLAPGHYTVVARFTEEGFSCDATNCGWSGAPNDCPRPTIESGCNWSVQGLNNPHVTISPQQPRHWVRLQALWSFPCI